MPEALKSCTCFEVSDPSSVFSFFSCSAALLAGRECGSRTRGVWELGAVCEVLPKISVETNYPTAKKKRVELLSRQELFEDQVPVFLRVQFHEKAS